MRGRCQWCLFAGEVFSVSYSDGKQVFRRRLCEHCALHSDTPAINCSRCFPKLDVRPP